MPKFSPPLPLFEPGRVDVSRGVTPRKFTADTSSSAGAAALVGLGMKGVSILDDTIKDTIVTEGRRINDEFINQDGLDPAGEVNDNSRLGRVGGDFEDETPTSLMNGVGVPDAIQSAFRQLERQSAGVSQGKLNQTFFLDRLDQQMRALRQRFPGHRDFIDGEGSRLSGLPSANSIFNQRRALNASSLASQEKSFRRGMKLTQDILATGHAIPPGMLDNMSESNKNRLLGVIRGQQERKRQLAIDKANGLLGEKQLIKDNQTQAQAEYRDSWEVVFANAPGGAKGQVALMRDMMANSHRFTPERLSEMARDLTTMMAEVDLQTGMRLQESISKIEPRSQFDIMQINEPGLTIDVAIKRVSSEARGLLQSYIDGDINLFNVYETQFNQSIADRASRLVKANPDLVMTRTLVKAYGKHFEAMSNVGMVSSLTTATNISESAAKFFASESLDAQKANNNYHLQTVLDFGKGAGSRGSIPTVTQTEYDRSVRAQGGSDNQIAASLKAGHDTSMAILLDPNMSREKRMERFKFFYNMKDKDYLLNVPTDQQQRVFNFRYNASVTKAVLEIGDPAMMKLYQTMAMSDLSQLNAKTVGQIKVKNPLVTLSINPETLEIKATKLDNPISELGLDFAPHEGSAKVLQDAVIGYNQMLNQFKGAMDAFGDGVEATGQDDTESSGTAAAREFYKMVTGGFEAPEAMPVNKQLAQEALANTPVDVTKPYLRGVEGNIPGSPPVLGDPEGLALLNTGRPEDDGGQTATADSPTATAALEGTTDAQGLDRTDFRSTLGSEGTQKSTPAAVATVDAAGMDDQTNLQRLEGQGPTSQTPPVGEAIAAAEKAGARITSDVLTAINKAGLDLDALITGIGSGSVGVDGNPTVPGEEARVARVNAAIAAKLNTDAETLAQRIGLAKAIEKLGVSEKEQQKVFTPGTIAEEIQQRKEFLDLLNNDSIKGFPDSANFGSGKDLSEKGDTKSEPIALESREGDALPQPSKEEQKVETKDFEDEIAQRHVFKAISPEAARRQRSILVPEVSTTPFTPLLDFISKGEGGYDSSNNGTAGGRIVGSTHNTSASFGQPLTEMTIGEIMDMQKGTRGSGRRLFAVGKYQIIPATMKSVMKDSKLKRSDLFSKENQDKLGLQLLLGSKRKALSGFLRGKHNNLKSAMLDLAKEWASMPNPSTGNSYYGSGNRALHSRKDVAAVLEQAREAFAGTSTDGGGDEELPFASLLREISEG